MSQMLEHALALAARGFHVFPCQVGGKLPIIEDFPNRATRDEAQIRSWWAGRECNVGISTSRFGDAQALIVVDVDVKEGKHGDASLLQLDLQGLDLPPTLEQSTPSGGRHLVYVADRAAKQGVDVLGDGLDVRSRGGYIVGPGSAIDGKRYRQINGHSELAPAPGWLVQRLGIASARPAAATEVLEGVDRDRAEARAIDYLKTAPASVEGQGGDITAYKVAAKLKDLGCSDREAFGLMAVHWNDRCVPPWSADDLREKVLHAYRYGKEPQGSAAPEAVFPKVEEPAVDDRHPADRFNDEYAFTPAGGGHVIWETTDPKGKPTVKHLDLGTFHAMHAAKTITAGEKKYQLTKLWMSSANRRSYDGFVFAPQRDMGPRWYNLWRGFSVQPAATASHPALDAFLEHARLNVCRGDEKLFIWLIGFFAHMVQRPWEKPLVALVFKGRKGTGKNALIERVGALLGGHFLLSSKRRYLVGQFNGHFENCLCIVLDEAFWSGDKESEGVLKDLITGTRHVIEHKGKEAFDIDNLTRVVILGNESWIVPASHDERRFAVFEMGEGRMRDRAFFQGMREGMEQGGYAHLLRYLLDFDLSRVDVNDAPNTAGLLAQKHASLEPVQEWWLDCLEADQLLGSSFAGAIPERVPTERMRDAFIAWSRSRNVRSRLPDARAFVAALRQCAPSMEKKRARVEDANVNAFMNPGIAVLRANWESHIGGKHRWDE